MLIALLTAVRLPTNNFIAEIGMTQVHEWGPHVWKILHYHAEYAGNSLLIIDEIRAWTSLLRHTEGVLACATCRQHYRAWRQAHPIEEFVGRDRGTFHEMLRKWLWELHESVNAKKDVQFPFEQLSIYKELPRQEVFQSMATLKVVLQKAVLHRQVNPTHVAEWMRALKFLQKLMF
jgi:hypothetical protein